MRKIDKNPFPFAMWPMQKKSIVYSYEELLRKAPAANLEGFTDEEIQALTSGRFAMRTPPPAVNVPERSVVPPVVSDEDDGGYPDDDYPDEGVSNMYSSTDISDEYAIEELYDRDGSVAEDDIRPGRIPLVNRQSAISLRDPDPWVRERHKIIANMSLKKWDIDKLRAKREILEQQGLLTDGKAHMQNAMLGAQHAFEIAKEYANWQANGRGPLPDLSRYERPVVRRKDGSNWEYSPELFDPENPDSLHPNNVWKFYDDLVKNPWEESSFTDGEVTAPGDYESSRIRKLGERIQDQKNGTYGSLMRHYGSTAELVSSAARFPLPPMVKEFAKKGTQHRLMTMLPPESAQPPVDLHNADEMISAIDPVKKSWFNFALHPTIKQP